MQFTLKKITTIEDSLLFIKNIKINMYEGYYLYVYLQVHEINLLIRHHEALT